MWKVPLLIALGEEHVKRFLIEQIEPPPPTKDGVAPEAQPSRSY
jgi:hypothetical protein